jgi:cyclopropane-fatty-acyl-phospholipid synthase
MSNVQSIPSERLQRRRTARSSLLIRPLERLLRLTEFGSISVVLPNGTRLNHEGAKSGPCAKVVVRRWRSLLRLMFGGELGFAQAFIDGDWWTPDLLATMAFSARNEMALSGSISGYGPARVFNRIKHWMRRNTRRGSERNIAAHYDLGNAFYAHWLDRDMNYSSGLFSENEQTLEAAQDTKLDRVTELLALRGGERLLEIGCGWGSLTERLLPECEVTGITLSAEQFIFAQQRLHARAHSCPVDLRLQDYRDVQGSYDRIASIEMIEAVGELYWPVYFAKLSELLAAGGIVVLQAITIDESRFATYRSRPDFIQRYIFPGGMLPTVRIIQREAEKAGFTLDLYEPFGQYARTLAIWRNRFLASWPAIQKLGFGPAFKQMWLYYLCYCEAGFREGQVNVGFFRLIKTAPASDQSGLHRPT